jgi:hypothetical protein
MPDISEETMETLGALIDKMSIQIIRKTHSKKRGVVRTLDQMVARSVRDIDAFFREAVSGRIRDPYDVCQPKLKNYAHQDNRVECPGELGKAAEQLIKANLALWDLEDLRRDTSLPAKARLKAADDVAVMNKTRNDAIDTIDRIMLGAWEKAKGKKRRGAAR